MFLLEYLDLLAETRTDKCKLCVRLKRIMSLKVTSIASHNSRCYRSSQGHAIGNNNNNKLCITYVPGF